MAGVQSQTAGVSNGAIYGARAAANIHAQGSKENNLYKSSSQNGLRNALSGSNGRTPLTNLAPNKSAGLLAPSNDAAVSRSGSEADSLLDLYGGRSSQNDLSNLDSDIPENMYRPEKYNEDPEGWIHRDKLAKIESEELQAAGINLANARKSMSRATSKRSNSNDKLDKVGGAELGQRPTREEKLVQRSPPVKEEEDNLTWDLRSPEEIAADEARSQPQNLRKPSSRIPVLSSSPLPIPSERVERSTPIARKRTLSGSISPDEGTPLPKIRPRQGSASSGMLLDEGEAIPTPGPRSVSTPSSPSKSKIVKPVATSSPASSAKKIPPGQRKGSGPVKNSSIPTNTPNQRPGTRSGEGDRPRTAVNKPEGDPPWLATMYKPDPRLPPDEQIIPTHARKQQQAQWADEGAVPNTYDREFAPLAVTIPDGPGKASSPIVSGGKSEDQEAWPLKPMPSVRSGSDSRPGTSGSQTAGYSTMPKVQNLQVKSPVASVSQSPIRGTFATKDGVPPPRMQQQRFDEEGQSGKKEKGCLGCCVVM